MDILVVLGAVLVVVFVWRGPKTLPRLAEALGRGVRAVREEAARGGSDEPEPQGGQPPTAQPPA